MDGKTVTLNGNVGNPNPVTSMVFKEMFVKVTFIVTGLWPIGTGPKSADVGEMVNDALAVSPCPLKLTSDVAPVASAVSVPGFAPRAVGVNVTGTVMVWPVDNVAGSVMLGAPIV